jgi:hypothetical protein
MKGNDQWTKYLQAVRQSVEAFQTLQPSTADYGSRDTEPDLVGWRN